MSLTYLEIDQVRSDYTELSGEVRRAFDERLVKAWMYHDHMLEGTVVTDSDITRALEGRPSRNYCDGLVQKSLRRMHELVNRFDGQARKGVEVSAEWITDLHRVMCDDDDVAGRYRQRDTSPGVYHLDVVDGADVDAEFTEFMAAWNERVSRLHPIRAAAVAHWKFMRVFPFDDRTGIVGRLMMNYILIKNFYPPAIIHANDRHHYFGALDGRPDDLVPVIADALAGTIQAARAFKRQARQVDQSRPAPARQMAM